MFYHLLYPLREFFFGFNVVRYITVRAACAGATAFLLCVLLGPRFIRWLIRMRVGQQIRAKAEHAKLHELHQSKQGTPTMGGLLVIGAAVGASLLWSNLTNGFVWLTIAITCGLGFVGFLDDYLKWVKHESKGLTARAKFLGQTLIAGALLFHLMRSGPPVGDVEVPFVKWAHLALGWWYVPFAMVVVVGASNAVNLTDGLDGLATGCLIMVAVAYAGMAYVTGHRQFAEYLGVYHAAQAGELAVVCAAIAGACLGFLWFNSYPATVFLGDTGALALGGAIGTVAVLIKKELLLALVGGVFVVESLSVILQVGSYKLRHKKRIFLVAPLHHHFQMLGWSETKVTVRFWIIGALLALMSLMTLKLR